MLNANPMDAIRENDLGKDEVWPWRRRTSSSKLCMTAQSGGSSRFCAREACSGSLEHGDMLSCLSTSFMVVIVGV